VQAIRLALELAHPRVTDRGKYSKQKETKVLLYPSYKTFVVFIVFCSKGLLKGRHGVVRMVQPRLCRRPRPASSFRMRL
jgi:hypothetical protein